MMDVRKTSKDIHTHTSHMTNPRGNMATAAVYQMCVPVFHQPGLSGKTVPELEKTVGLLKKVVERVQRENETLKKSGASAAAQQETLRLKVGLRFPRPPASTAATLFNSSLSFIRYRTRLKTSGAGAKPS